MEQAPILAICYDFDHTLSPDDMQAAGYIQSVGFAVEDFWQESRELAEQNEMDRNLAYMYLMAKTARGKVLFTRERLAEYGAQVPLYPGVREWFANVNALGEAAGVRVEHYIISSGLKEMIAGTAIANEFKAIYASSFFYDEDGVAVWPAQEVNYTNKTQFLFRIKKGVLDVNDDRINEYFPNEEMRVPFRNIVYIGDSATDIPCMKLVASSGGHAIGVYAPGESTAMVDGLLRDGRIQYKAPADYRQGAPLEQLIGAIIAQTATRENLERRKVADLHDAKSRLANAKQGQ